MMRKNTVRLFVLAFSFAGSITVSAQTKQAKLVPRDTDVEKLKELSVQYKEKYESEYANAVRLAKVHDWPLVIRKEDGGLSTLTRVSDKGTPIYTTTYNAGSIITSRADHLHPGGSLGLNLTGEFADGEQMIVGVWDGGYPLAGHQAFGGRTVPFDGSGSPVAFHPTHVTGTVIGSGAGNSLAKGLAPAAFAYVSTYENDFGEMAGFASSGYILSNHSYGLDESQFGPEELAEIMGSYLDYSEQVDVITFEAPYYQPVFAAGNSSNGTYDRLTDRSVSKNGIAVAAIDQINNYTGPEDVMISTFSSWGPTNDNRIKPDISTKGHNVLSASNTGISSYGLSSGTSMASPGVTGVLVLLQQYYSILHPSATSARNFMRSSTVRALISHTADEAGGTDGPDPIFGWGVINAKRAAEVLAADKANTSAEIQELILLPGQTYTQEVSVSGTEPLIATLAWTDPAGNPTTSSTAVLVNNLDLKITKGGTTYFPWRLDGTGTAAEKGDNNVDNIEKIEVPNPSGTYTITISHKNATLINPGGAPQQAYSLIVSGLDGIAGINDQEKTSALRVWPNPAQDQITISFTENIEKGAGVTIYDIQGRQVLTSVLTGPESNINVQDFAKGVYIVSIVNGSRTHVEKIIIK